MSGESVTLIIIIIIVFFYKWNETVEEFKLPWYYLYLIWMLLAQKLVTFIVKMVFFGPTFLIYLCFTKCKRASRQDDPRLSDELQSNLRNENSLNNISAIFGAEGLHKLQADTWHRNLELDRPINTSRRSRDSRSEDEPEVSKELYTYKKFYKRKYLSSCTYRFHLRIYPLM